MNQLTNTTNIDRLVARVQQERRNARFPKHCGRMNYTKETRELAAKILKESKCPVAELATITELSPNTLKLWMASTEDFPSENTMVGIAGKMSGVGVKRRLELLDPCWREARSQLFSQTIAKQVK